MKKILLAAAIFSIFSFQFSTLKAQQPDAVFKLLRYEWTLNADGTSDYHYRHEVQIERNRALTAYADKGETFVVYNPDLEELTVNEVYTVRPDGSRVEMPQNAFIYQLPSECADCGRFNHMRELAMVHTGMEIGCTIVVDYTLHRKYNLLYESIPLQRECPVEKMEIVVDNRMNGMEVSFDTLGKDYLAPLGLDVRRVGTSTTYTLRNVPQAPREAYMPEDIVPVLRIFNGTPDYTPAFDKAPFDNYDIVVPSTPNQSAHSYVTFLRDYVVDYIHLNDIHPSHLGYTHATPAQVWASGCGTPTDKAVLLAAILNNEGYVARVIGGGSDMVGVMIDTVEYLLDVRHKTPIEVNGEARDEVTPCRIEQTMENMPPLDSIDGSFYRFAIQMPQNNVSLPDVRWLPATRVTPLVAAACDYSDNLSYPLPKGVKLAGPKVEQQLDFPGIGSVKIVICQKGKKLLVQRALVLEKSLVPAKDYPQYRQLLALWNQYATYQPLLRKK